MKNGIYCSHNKGAQRHGNVYQISPGGQGYGCAAWFGYYYYSPKCEINVIKSLTFKTKRSLRSYVKWTDRQTTTTPLAHVHCGLNILLYYLICSIDNFSCCN